MKQQKQKVILVGIILIVGIVMIGIVRLVLLQGNQTDSNKDEAIEQEESDKNYRLLSESDREIADFYAELYETSSENVAKLQKDTGDWAKTAKKLEENFFTIPENIKYQMNKEGYSFDDMAEAEKLSIQTGRKAMELLREKGIEAEHRSWSEVVKDDEILTSEEQLGLSKEQVTELEKLSLEKRERVEVAILILNNQYTYEEVIKRLEKGLTIEELKRQVNHDISDDDKAS